MEKTKKTECLICLDSMPIKGKKYSDPKLNFSNCDHLMCSGCIQDFIKHEITEKKFPVKCPGENCIVQVDPSYIKNNFDKKILNDYLELSLLKC